MADPESSSSVQSAISNDDLLTEILVRLPVLSLFLFKPVSKRWFSLIKEAANLTFRGNRKPDPPSGLIISMFTSITKDEKSLNYEFMPLDTRIPDNFTFGSEDQNERRDVDILDSCNGLLLYRALSSMKLYVCNPSITNMFKVLSEPYKVTCYHIHAYGAFKMAFDPTKSPHYKVIYAEIVYDQYDAINGLWVQIQTFSSETGNWSPCGHRFSQNCFYAIKSGVYWNDAIYWATNGKVFKLDIMNEHSVLTTFPTPDEKLRYAYKLFESRGCLLLFSQHFQPSSHYSIYEKGNVYSEWSVKCTVNLDDIAERYSHGMIFGIVLGEREEDSFLVWLVGRKVVKHKIVSKTLSRIADLGPNDGLLGCFQFIPSFANV